MAWQFGVASDIGGREEQQDRVDVIASPNGDAYLVVLADGMGGHHGGALAAQAVMDSAKQYFDGNTTDDPLSALESLCSHAHQSIASAATQANQPPGSTCVMLHVSGDEASWAHVGDSRLYHIRNGEVLSRTLDHSMCQLLVSQGEMAESDMADSPLQNQLYMCLGGEQPPTPDLAAAEVKGGDVFMLCSDGFWERVDLQEVSTTLSDKEPQEAVAQLVQLARQRGGENGDNISLVIARFEKDGKKFPWFS